MFTIVWWYLAATFVAILAGLFMNPAGFYIAIALCFIQALHFGIEDKNFFSFSCQVRYVLAGIFIAGLWEPMSWIYWIPVIGLTARLSVNYCLLARLMSLLPWNRKQPLSGALIRKTIFSPPTNKPIEQWTLSS